MTFNKNKLCKTLGYWSRDMLRFVFFRKESGNTFSIKFCVWFFKENVSHAIFCQPSKSHYLITFTSWDNGHYVYCNCLLTSFWHYNVWNYYYLSNQAVFLHEQEVKANIWILWGGEKLLRWNKFFIIFKGL